MENNIMFNKISNGITRLKFAILFCIRKMNLYKRVNVIENRLMEQQANNLRSRHNTCRLGEKFTKQEGNQSSQK